MTRYKSAITVRGDCLYCPLPLSIDSYWNCLTDCHHCYMRRLNRTWGPDLRPSDPEGIRRKLENGLKNKNPKSSLAWALFRKKTVRIGNKTDPYQDAEKEFRITRRILRHLIELSWTFVIQTRHTGNLKMDDDLLDKARKSVVIMPIITPGGERDWEVLERKRTTPILNRFQHLKRWIRLGRNVGVNGEPFIPGFHTESEFADMLRRLKGVGVSSYNTYNLHLNDYVAKRFAEIGLDIEKIWTMNQDRYWKPLQRRLCQIADEVGIRLGCPDFVNTGWGWKEKANTCCGINVPRPSRFNAHHWKMMLQRGVDPSKVLESTWEGIGDKRQGKEIIEGKSRRFYTMRDAKAKS